MDLPGVPVKVPESFPKSLEPISSLDFEDDAPQGPQEKYGQPQVPVLVASRLDLDAPVGVVVGRSAVASTVRPDEKGARPAEPQHAHKADIIEADFAGAHEANNS